METLLPFEKIEKTVLIKRDTKTGANYGKRPEDRTISELIESGIIIVDKPAGPTSHQVSAYVQKILGINKSGHSGTLDPNVTGVLPVALGTGTKIVQALLPAGKEYIMLMHVHKEIDTNVLTETIRSFIGKIKQLPPIKSAVKRQWRYRKIYYIDIIENNGQDVLMRVGCQAGTYMRKLCTDIGVKLKTGAHMAELRRSKAGPFQEKDAVTLHNLTDGFQIYKEEGNERLLKKMILPLETGVGHLFKIWVTDSTVNTLCNGANLNAPGIARIETGIQADELVAVMTLKDELICIGMSQMHSNEMKNAQKGLAVITSKVFMNPGIYPKMQRKE